MSVARAYCRNIRGSSKKMILVANHVRGKSVEKALDLLKFSTKKHAAVLRKVLVSAVANAENNHQLDVDTLIISQIIVNRASHMKRWRAQAKGRGARIIKRSCHVLLEVKDRTFKMADHGEGV